MSIISVTTYGSDPQTVNSANLNALVTPIVTDYNGNIDNTNIATSAGIANSKLNLATISQAVTHTGGLTVSTVAQTMTAIAINEAKGADIASATTTDIGAATGNYAHITGTTTITGLGTIQEGTRRIVEFDGILILTHNSSSLILPTGANITTAAGDTAVMVSEGSGNWRCTSYQRKDGTALTATAITPSTSLSKSTIQTVITQSSAVATSTGTAIDDDTVPQLTECPVVTALNTAITASSSSNTLIITATLNIDTSASNVVIAALFLDSATSASAATRWTSNSPAQPAIVSFQFSVSPADTSAHTYKIGLGIVSSGTITLNGTGGSRRLGGVQYSTVKIEEIKA